MSFLGKKNYPSLFYIENFIQLIFYVREWEFAHTEELSGVGTASENWIQPKFSTLYSHKTPTWPTCNACFSLARFTHMGCLMFIGHALHPSNVCFSLAMVYNHAMLVLNWSQFTPTHSLFPAIILLILSKARGDVLEV